MNLGGKIGQLSRKTISGMFERHKIPTYMEAYLAVGPTVCKRNKGRYVKSFHSGSQVYSIALQNECN